MDIKKLVLYMILAFLGVMLWNAWNKDHAQQAQQVQQSAQQNSSPTTFNPTTVQNPATTTKGNTSPTAQTAALSSALDRAAVKPTQTVSVTTDMLQVKINLNGGNLIAASLPKYPLTLQTPNVPVQILDNDPNHLYVAETGLTNTADNLNYHSQQTSYVLAPNQKTLDVVLQAITTSGLHILKTYHFVQGSYEVITNYQITNTSKTPWTGSMFAQIVRRNTGQSSGLFRFHTYEGAAISSPDKPYEKLSYETLDKTNVDRNIKGGWVAMQQHYFLSAWVPNDKAVNHYYSSTFTPADSSGKQNIYTIGYVMPAITINPGANANVSSKFYVGPEIAKNLKAVAPGLDLTIDFGWLWPISIAIFWVMQKIYAVVGNWGWSIVLVTLFIKLLFYKLSESSYMSMARMRDLQPRMQALKQRFGDDRQALSRATMELYKKDKINPLGGCLPMLVQIPVFIALYYVLIESVQLRQAPFILWIRDLSVHDPYYILPVLMGISMFVQQKLSPKPADQTQARVMMMLPLVFTIFFMSFPAGLVLYWLVNNCLSILQQWIIMKRFEARKHAQKSKR